MLTIIRQVHQRSFVQCTNGNIKFLKCFLSYSPPSHRADDVTFPHPSLNRAKDVLKAHDVCPSRGFLPSEDPLQRLPRAEYKLWDNLGFELPSLLSARFGRARAALSQLPIISTEKLTSNAELRRAHLLLSMFAHAYVWGGNTPMDVIPKGIAVPLWEVSQALSIPPVLGQSNIILYNWKRFDNSADISMENLAALNLFFGGRDESWFYLITVDVEAKGAVGILPMMLAMDTIAQFNSAMQTPSDSKYWDSVILSTKLVTEQLNKVANAIRNMCDSIGAMREGCHPFIFYHRVRPFSSGWKHNPTLPNGVIYEGVSTDRLQYYGGSAAQSSLIPFYDICLGIEHDSPKSKEFLLAMRDYMIKPHREFLKYLESTACLRQFVLDRSSDLAAIEKGGESLTQKQDVTQVLQNLQTLYDMAVSVMAKFRTMHMSIVSEYIIAQQKNVSTMEGLENASGGKGTGGTDLITFLKPLRQDCTDK